MPGSKGQGNGVGIEVILKASAWFAKHKDELHGLSIPEIMKQVQADLGVTAVKQLAVTEQNVQKLIEIAGLVAETLEALGEGSAERQIRHLFPAE